MLAGVGPNGRRPLGAPAGANGQADPYGPRADANGPKRTEILSEMGRPAGDALMLECHKKEPTAKLLVRDTQRSA